jgi:hypothetical protein
VSPLDTIRRNGHDNRARRPVARESSPGEIIDQIAAIDEAEQSFASPPPADRFRDADGSGPNSTAPILRGHRGSGEACTNWGRGVPTTCWAR